MTSPVDHVAGGVLGADLPQRIPGADIAPAHRHRPHHRRVLRVLHHRVVERHVLRSGEGVAVEAQEVEVALGALERLAAGGERRRPQPLHLAHQDRGGQEEDAAVPAIIAGIEIGLSARAVGLLDEGRDRGAVLGAGDGGAAPDIAIAGLGPVGGDAEGDELSQRRGARGAVDGGEEGRHVGDHVIGRQRQQQRIGVVRQQDERGDRHRGRGVAAHGLEHDGARGHAHQPQLLGHHEAVLVVGR